MRGKFPQSFTPTSAGFPPTALCAGRQLGHLSAGADYRPRETVDEGAVQVTMSQLKFKNMSPDLQNEIALHDAILAKLTYELGKTPELAGPQDWYHATALAVRDRVVDVWMRAHREIASPKKGRA